MVTTTSKGYRGIGMEGWIATWYARNALRDLEDYRKAANLVTKSLTPGSSVLELASGPGLLAIEIARSGNYHVGGLDISHTFVSIAQENAAEAGVNVDFRHGNAADMPYGEGEWDFIVCRAAFKNFSDPLASLNEMYRVLKPGGQALILDLRGDVPGTTIDEYVNQMGRNGVDRFITRWVFKNMLVKRAHSEKSFRELASESNFRKCEIHTHSIELNVWLMK